MSLIFRRWIPVQKSLDEHLLAFLNGKPGVSGDKPGYPVLLSVGHFASALVGRKRALYLVAEVSRIFSLPPLVKIFIYGRCCVGLGSNTWPWQKKGMRVSAIEPVYYIYNPGMNVGSGDAPRPLSLLFYKSLNPYLKSWSIRYSLPYP